MKMLYGQKTIECLRLASLPIGSEERRFLREQLCEKYSEKAIVTTIVNHTDLFEWGVWAGAAWLTEKGKVVLADVERDGR